jgi:hypothetical protein
MKPIVSLDVLDRIRIASPCHARWEDMAGDDRKRFCCECSLHVYNLSAMTRDEAVELVSGAEGRLCAGFWRRPDGTILTQDCPVGIAARAAAATRRMVTTIALLLGAGLMIGATRGPAWRLRQVQPFATVCDWLRPPAKPVISPPPPGRVVLGSVSCATATYPSTPDPAIPVVQANGGKR